MAAAAPAPKSRQELLDQAVRTANELMQAVDSETAQAMDARLAEARRWLERARRLAPADPTVRFSLATLCLHQGDPAGEALLAELAVRHDVREIWLGLAAIRHRAGDTVAAAEAAARCLAGHAVFADIAALAPAVAQAAGLPGWCGLDGDGRLTVGGVAGQPEISCDGVAVAWRGGAGTRAIGRQWGSARRLTVRIGGMDLLGSPIDVAAIRRLEGFVTVKDGGLTGWAWHPADPDRRPELLLIGPGETVWPIHPDETTVVLPGGALLARPRGLSVPPIRLAHVDAPVRLVDRDGRDLFGSPLDPRGEVRAAAALARHHAGRGATAAMPWLPLPVLARPPWPDPPEARADVDATVVLVVESADHAEAAVQRLIATTEVPIIVVPADAHLGAALGTPSGRITVLAAPRPAGWAAAANAGIDHAGGRDVALLDTTVLVTRGWLTRLQAVCRRAADIGSASPMGGEAGLLRWPVDHAGLDRLASQAARAHRIASTEIPLARERCVYLRRDCLEQTGRLRPGIFTQGEGAVADLSLRAAALGWRHVAAHGVVVGEQRDEAGPAVAALEAHNRTLLARLHSGLEALRATHPAERALSEARRRLAAARWRHDDTRPCVILITHADGGGVERHIRGRCETWRAAGRRPVILRPAPREDGPNWCLVTGAADDDDVADLRFELPHELAALAALLRDGRPELIEVHHLLGHHHCVLDLARLLGIPYDVFVHDHAWFCPRILLVGRDRRYCGEPDLAGCEACIADLGSALEEDITVADLRLRSATDLGGARRVVAPSRDTAMRLHRHFPVVRPQVMAWEDAPLPDAAPRRTAADAPRRPLADAVSRRSAAETASRRSATDTVSRRSAAETASRRSAADTVSRRSAADTVSRRSAATLVCVPGAIGIEKGFEVVLDCARDAAARRLSLSFVVVGHTIDDARLLDTGRVFVTGEYQDREAVALIASQYAMIGFIPSLWPETWCYTLSHMWAAGLAVLAFDIGAPAERIGAGGLGRVLPLGLRTSAVNNALLAYAAEVGNDPSSSSRVSPHPATTAVH